MLVPDSKGMLRQDRVYFNTDSKFGTGRDRLCEFCMLYAWKRVAQKIKTQRSRQGTENLI